MCASCGTPLATMSVVLGGCDQSLGRPAPTCTTSHSFESCACFACSGALVVRQHQPHRRRRGGRRCRGSGHSTSVFGARCSLYTRTSRNMYMVAAGGWYATPPVGGGGWVTLAAVVGHMEVQTVRGDLRACVGVLHGRGGWMSCRRRSCVPVVLNRLTRASRHPG